MINLTSSLEGGEINMTLVDGCEDWEEKED